MHNLGKIIYAKLTSNKFRLSYAPYHIAFIVFSPDKITILECSIYVYFQSCFLHIFFSLEKLVNRNKLMPFCDCRGAGMPATKWIILSALGTRCPSIITTPNSCWWTMDTDCGMEVSPNSAPASNKRSTHQKLDPVIWEVSTGQKLELDIYRDR